MLTNAVNAELLHSGCGAPDAICVPLPDCGAEVGVLWLLLPEGRMLCNHPARHLYCQIDRAHRDWSEAQIGFLANIVRLYRGEAVDVTLGGRKRSAGSRPISAAKRKPSPSTATSPGCARRPHWR